jgi:dipeptidyl-peptidase-4
MRRLWLGLLLGVTGCVSSGTSRSQGGSGVIADPAFLEQYATTRRFSAGQPTAVKLVPDGSAVLLLRSPARSFVQDLYEFNTATGQERRLLTADQILQGAEENLSVEERARRERMRMSARGIASYQLSKDGTKILVPLSGRLFVIERASGTVRELISDAGFPLDPRLSPDGRSLACVRGNELYVMDIASGAERRLTNGSNATLSHGLAEFVAQEEMDRSEGYWWSPDSKTLVYQETSTEGMEMMHIADATHPDKEPQAWAYPRPGQKNAVVRLGLIPIEGGDTRWVNWDRERYPYLATVRWQSAPTPLSVGATEQAPLTILVQNRQQTEEALLLVDIETGSTTLLLVEKDEAWINLDQAMPKWFPDGSAFLWTTERNGSWQLELRSADGQLLRPLAGVDFRYKGFVDLDPEKKFVHVSGGGDPTQTHLFRLSTEVADAPVQLTTEPGIHSATFSENHRVYVHTASTMDGRRSQIVRSTDGRELGRLQSVAEKPPFVPNIELTTVGMDPSFHAVLVRPRNFDSRRRYPVIVSVYGGPHAQTVVASPSAYLLQQWIADHGFIVVSIDGRGTPSRGRSWERIIKGNLIEISLNDQVAGLKALARKYGELDLDRVGIYGWSFGGYFSAMAVIRRPDVFDVGVAGAPVAEWLDYDTHYTERYLGLPDENPSGYADSSVLTYAKDLDRSLLIIHGTADDNVYFSHSLKMSNALFRAGKTHDFLALSDFTHMVADPLVTTRLYQRIVGYFVKHLAHDTGFEN